MFYLKLSTYKTSLKKQQRGGKWKLSQEYQLFLRTKLKHTHRSLSSSSVQSWISFWSLIYQNLIHNAPINFVFVKIKTFWTWTYFSIFLMDLHRGRQSKDHLVLDSWMFCASHFLNEFTVFISINSKYTFVYYLLFRFVISFMFYLIYNAQI